MVSQSRACGLDTLYAPETYNVLFNTNYNIANLNFSSSVAMHMATDHEMIQIIQHVAM